jgi:tetratricopeptide (TPR) repeat protein
LSPAADLPGRWALLALALVLAFALYANALGNPFLSDDTPLIVTNPTITELSGVALRKLWTTPYLMGIRRDGSLTVLFSDPNPYRPVAAASFWMNAWVTGVEPVGFRVVNVVLHALAAWLIALLASRWSTPAAGVIAGGVVLLHPIATDVINRIIGRSELLVVVGLAGFLCTQRAAQLRGWTWSRVALAAGAAAVALGGKESGAVLVPLALTQAWLGRERAPHAWRGALALCAPAGLYLAVRLATVGTPHWPHSAFDLHNSPLPQWTLLARVPASLTLAWDYLVRLLVPWPLMAFDTPARFPLWGDAGPWLGLAVVAALAAALVWSLRRRHPLAVGLTWLLSSYLLVSHLLVPATTYRELRLAYPLVAGAALGVGVLLGGRRWPMRAARSGGIAVAAAAALAAAVLVVQRNAECSSTFALVEVDVRRRPLAPTAQAALADLLDLAGRSAEAERAYVRVTLLAPGSYQAWLQLAGFYRRSGQREEARRGYERAVAIDATLPDALRDLGVIAMEAGALVEARGRLLAAERADLTEPYTQYNFAVLETREGKERAAIVRLERLVTDHPHFALATAGLARLREPAVDVPAYR